jgi:hypothetical protein
MNTDNRECLLAGPVSSILAMNSGHTELITREAIEIELHPNNMNWEEDFSLSKSRKPLLQTLKE